MPIIGLANRKEAITLYLSYSLNDDEDLKRLGKYRIGKSCLYLRKLDDVDIGVLKRLITHGIEDTMKLPFIRDNERED